MRILFLTNLYPPRAAGGYEQWCQEVAVEFTRRGHAVAVLTSGPDVGEAADDGVEVRRDLHLEVKGGLVSTVLRVLRDRERHERENLDRLERLVAEFRPDLAVVWGMWNVPRSVPARLERLLPGRVAYYLCDYWLTLPSAYVQQLANPSTRALTRLPKRLVGWALLGPITQEPRVPLRLENPICVSQAVREILTREGVPIEHARVIQGGIQVDDFAPRSLARWDRLDGPLRLVYAGRLAEEKGVYTAVRAMALLTPRADRPVTLDLVGTGASSYLAGLHELVRRHGLADQVRFHPRVPRERMPDLLANYGALLFPSEWPEPFGRAVMEAMAVGLVVIGTTTGGTGDVLVEGETGLTFPAGDAAVLARQIERLRDDRAMGQRLARTARRRVAEQFTFARMVDEIEEYLDAMLRARVG